MKSLSHVQPFATPWTVAHQAPPSMGFSRQEYWSGLPFPSPGDLPDPGIEQVSPTLQTDSLPTEPTGNPLQRIFRTNFLYDGLVGSPCSPRDSQESSSTPSSKALILQHSVFFIVQLSHPYMTARKTVALTRQSGNV